MNQLQPIVVLSMTFETVKKISANKKTMKLLNHEGDQLQLHIDVEIDRYRNRYFPDKESGMEYVVNSVKDEIGRGLFDYYESCGLVSREYILDKEGRTVLHFTVSIPGTHSIQQDPVHNRTTIGDLFKTIGDIVSLPLRIFGM